jgi:hypothetical protein
MHIFNFARAADAAAHRDCRAVVIDGIAAARDARARRPCRCPKASEGRRQGGDGQRIFDVVDSRQDERRLA